MRLSAHHTRPLYRELFRMGRGKKQWPQQQRDYSWSSEASPSWKLWEGSWSASPKAPPPTQLRYDQVTVKTTRPTARADPSSGWSEDSLGDFAGQHHRDVQKALTQARKADIRVRKLKEDIAHRKLQWEHYSATMRTAFQQQKKRFQADVQKQEQEIQEAMEAGKQAAQMMHDIVLNGSTTEAPDPTADKDWEELTRDDKMEVEHGPGFLQAAMSAARAVRASQRDPVTPPRRTATAAPMTPAHNVTEEMAKQIALMYHAMQANMEPYQASPGQNKTPPPPGPCLDRWAWDGGGRSQCIQGATEAPGRHQAASCEAWSTWCRTSRRDGRQGHCPQAGSSPHGSQQGCYASPPRGHAWTASLGAGRRRRQPGLAQRKSSLSGENGVSTRDCPRRPGHWPGVLSSLERPVGVWRLALRCFVATTYSFLFRFWQPPVPLDLGGLWTGSCRLVQLAHPSMEDDAGLASTVETVSDKSRCERQGHHDEVNSSVSLFSIVGIPLVCTVVPACTAFPLDGVSLGHCPGLSDCLPDLFLPCPVLQAGFATSALDLGADPAILLHLATAVDVSMRVPHMHFLQLGRSNCARFGCMPCPHPHRPPLWFSPLPWGFSIRSTPDEEGLGPVLFTARCQIGTSVALGYQPSYASQFAFYCLLAAAATIEALLCSWLPDLCWSFGHSLALTVLALLVALVLGPIGRASWSCRRLIRPVLGCSHLRALNALAVACPQDPVLSWRSQASHKGHRKGRSSVLSQGSGSQGRRLLGVLLALLLPQPTEAIPAMRISCAILPLSVFAMTRPETHVDPPGESYVVRRPHLIPPDEPTSHVGTCPMSTSLSPGELDAFDSDRTRVLQPDLWEEHLPADVEGWLGVYLFTPHYKTLMLAIRPPEYNLQATADFLAVPAAEAQIPFDTVLPLRPQRLTGYGYFIRFHSSAKHTGFGGQVAVVLDLTCVGGHFFATFLPRSLSYQTLIEYITPLTSDGELAVYVGCRSSAWPENTWVELSDGEVIIVLRARNVDFPKPRASDLFLQGATWGPLRHMPRLEYHDRVCVLFRHQRYCLAPYYHTDQSVVEYVCEKLRLDPHATAMCSFPIADLEVQGALATYLIAVAEVPSQHTTGINRSEARDIFVLIDPRPLGFKPAFLFIHHPIVHLPTVVALLGLAMPQAYQIRVLGGRRERDDIIVDGCTTLVLVPEPRPFDRDDDSSTSSAPAALPEAPPGNDPTLCALSPVDLSSPYDQAGDPAASNLTAWDGAPSPTFAGAVDFDTTLPAEHTWNLGLHDPSPDLPAGASQAQAPPTVAAASADFAAGSPIDHNARVAGPTCIQALIYAPDFVPEIITVHVSLPVTVVHLLSALLPQRLDSQARCFPELFPAAPQPIQELAVIVAAPEWQIDTVVVLFDCRRCNECLFACVVHRLLSRESLLIAAGFPMDAALHVYVHGLIHPPEHRSEDHPQIWHDSFHCSPCGGCPSLL